MLLELVLRFLLGGTIVAAFAMLGEIFRPKTFAGIFGAAPSVAIATLALTFGKDGATYAGLEARSMLLGSAGLFVYSAALVRVAKNEKIPVWLGAGAAWVAWFAVTIVLFLVIGGRGAS